MFKKLTDYDDDIPEFNNRIGPLFDKQKILLATKDAITYGTQAPESLVVVSVLSALSLCLQASHDVKTPSGQINPVSIMALAIAESGERKSSIDKIVYRTLREFEAAGSEFHAIKLNEHKSLIKVYKDKQTVFRKLLKDKLAKGEETLLEEQRIKELEQLISETPKKFKLMYDDTTMPRLLEGLFHHFDSAGLMSAEGGSILNGSTINEFSYMNKLWSGESIDVTRKRGDDVTLNDARLTACIFVQPAVADAYLKTGGKLARGSGQLARFLVCFPLSNIGYREIGFPEKISIGKFEDRIGELILLCIERFKGQKKRSIVEFDTPASNYWLRVARYIESQSTPNGRFERAKDHASKLADNIARVAALIHTFEGYDGKINHSTLKAAVDICFYFSDEFLRIFDAPPQEIIDAELLLDWFKFGQLPQNRFIRKNNILKFGPNSLRSKKRLDEALDVLVHNQDIHIFKFKNTWIIDLFPQDGYPSENHIAHDLGLIY